MSYLEQKENILSNAAPAAPGEIAAWVFASMAWLDFRLHEASSSMDRA
jgi:hypothetical protein